MNKDISIIIVSWNTRDLVVNCIKSVYKTVENFSFETWVVDNGSKDGSQHAVRKRFPEVHLIENEENKGYSMANNQALKLINGRYAVLLNSDTVLKNGAIETIVKFMDENKAVAICGAQLLNSDGTKQNSIANIPNLTTELLNKSLLRRLFPKKYPGKERDFQEPSEVESVIGACMVVRREAIDDVGRMDEDYFFFLEETDWCLQMRKKGWKVFHHPEAKIYHLQGQSAGKFKINARIEYWISRYIFFEKNYGKDKLLALKTWLLIKLFLSTLLITALNIICLLTNKKFKFKFKLNIKLIVWHIRGRPKNWGLRTSHSN